MADIKFIESLNIEDNIFELKENCIIGYLVHYCAPFTGGGEHELPAGIRFCLHGPMRDDAMYMHMIDDFPVFNSFSFVKDRIKAVNVSDYSNVCTKLLKNNIKAN